MDLPSVMPHQKYTSLTKEENTFNYMGNTADSMTDVPDSISSTPRFPIDNKLT